MWLFTECKHVFSQSRIYAYKMNRNIWMGLQRMYVFDLISKYNKCVEDLAPANIIYRNVSISINMISYARCTLYRSFPWTSGFSSSSVPIG